MSKGLYEKKEKRGGKNKGIGKLPCISGYQPPAIND